MFGGKFSLQRFSLRGEMELETKVTAFFTENIRSMVSIGQNTGVENNFRAIIGNVVTLTRGIGIRNDFNETINASVSMYKNVFVINDFREIVRHEVRLASNIDVANEFIENIDMQAYLSINTPLTARLSEDVRQESYLSKNIFIIHNLREAVFTVSSANILTREMFTIDVTVPAGSEIRIDSDNFTVTLDGENIIYLYNGDWFNLDRNAVNMHISTGSGGNIDGQLLYLERFL